MRRKMALSCSKTNIRAIFTIFSSFLRQKQLWNLYFPRVAASNFFSGKSVMMSYHQKLCSWAKARGGAGWYKRFSWKIAKKWLKLSKIMIFFGFFSRIIHKKWPIRYLLAKHIRGKYFEFFPLFIGPYVRKYCKKKSNFCWKLVFFYQNNHTALLNSAITCF